jgi:hypothetical protein
MAGRVSNMKWIKRIALHDDEGGSDDPVFFKPPEEAAEWCVWASEISK